MTGAGVRRSGGAAFAAVTATSNAAAASKNFGSWRMCLSIEFVTTASDLYAFEWSVRRKLSSAGSGIHVRGGKIGCDLARRDVQTLCARAGGSCLSEESCPAKCANLPRIAAGRCPGHSSDALPRKNLLSTLHSSSAVPFSVTRMDPLSPGLSHPPTGPA